MRNAIRDIGYSKYPNVVVQLNIRTRSGAIAVPVADGPAKRTNGRGLRPSFRTPTGVTRFRMSTLPDPQRVRPGQGLPSPFLFAVLPIFGIPSRRHFPIRHFFPLNLPRPERLRRPCRPLRLCEFASL